ncbi:MAG: chromate efflux transporter [Proteobacteria bacterium]|nr:chromate efflux transporter [Pseudomonadota bacterium]
MKDQVERNGAGPGSVESTGSRGSAFEVLKIFTGLGFTCFGGPIAHLGYFRTEFVTRRKWLSESAYADLVALCQFLPGPASSKVGFSLGLLRGGYWGGFMAWLGFTLPSAVLLVLFAYGTEFIAETEAGQGLIRGLKLTAVAIVAHAVLGMARALTPDATRASIGALAAVIALLAPTSIGQIAAIVFGGFVGWRLCGGAVKEQPEVLDFSVSRRVGIVATVLLAILLAAALVPLPDSGYSMFNAFFRSGALVFGGGHVVLPLLNEAVVAPGWVSEEDFLAGYGAAQAVPGPLFTFGAYLGAVATAPVVGPAAIAIGLFAIFLPGILLQLAALPFWNMLRGRPTVQAMMRGVNASVVGILGAALYTPIWTSVVAQPADFAVALIGFVLLLAWRAPALAVVAFCALSGVALSVMA